LLSRFRQFEVYLPARQVKRQGLASLLLSLEWLLIEDRIRACSSPSR